MLTIEDAKRLTPGTTLYHLTAKMADRKTPARARVNGKPQTWKTRPNEVKVPMKHGLRDTFYITESNLSDWTLFS